MPWKIVSEDGRHCVYKLGEDDKPMGKPLGCHDTAEEAEAHMQALYANAEEDMPMKRRGRALKDVEYKVSPTLTQQVTDRLVVGIAGVMGNIDDGNDITWPGAFTKTIKEGKTRVRHLWNHDMNQPPTAVIRDLREIGRGELPSDLTAKFPDAKGGLLVAREYLDTPRGSEVLAGIRAGAINEMSFGFVPVRKDYQTVEGKNVRNLREVRLLDTSDVPWGMNPASRAVKALPFKESPTAAHDAPWDGPAEFARAEIDDLKQMCAWVDTEDPENKSSYKLAHHRADDGHSVVWRAVAAAMSALLGGPGGSDIPDEDRRAVYEHLVKHYAQFDQEPPDYKVVELFEGAATMQRLYTEAEGKIGRMINAANMRRLKQAVDVLQEILVAAQPPDPEAMMEKALTVRQIFLELEQAELDIERQRVNHG